MKGVLLDLDKISFLLKIHSSLGSIITNSASELVLISDKSIFNILDGFNENNSIIDLKEKFSLLKMVFVAAKAVSRLITPDLALLKSFSLSSLL